MTDFNAIYWWHFLSSLYSYWLSLSFFLSSWKKIISLCLYVYFPLDTSFAYNDWLKIVEKPFFSLGGFLYVVGIGSNCSLELWLLQLTWIVDTIVRFEISAECDVTRLDILKGKVSPFSTVWSHAIETEQV